MKPQHALNIIFYVSIVLSLIAALLFETNTIIGGWWADNRSADFLCTTFLELFSLLAIPVAFRLVRPGRSDVSRMSYERRALLRLVLLALPLVFNIMAYYAFMGAQYGYMTCILFVALLFVVPTPKRFEREKHSLQNTPNKPQEDEAHGDNR